MVGQAITLEKNRRKKRKARQTREDKKGKQEGTQKE